MEPGALPQLLRPSAISGLVRLRARLQDEPDMPIETLCRKLTATYDGAGLDVEGACALHRLVSREVVDRQELYRHVIRMVAAQTSPTWGALLRAGRDALLVADPDVVTCFQRAGAFDSFPTPNVTEWWDELAGLAYMNADISRMAVGRRAERLSMEYEQRRLAKHENAPRVVWKSLDSNAAGYDIQSWRLLDGRWVPAYIEVKGTQQEPPRIFVTKNEWSVAVRHGSAYSFHVWDVARSKMAEVSVAQMAAWVPADTDVGAWEEASLRLPHLVWTPGQ